ncbi:MAG: PepSY-associated TM helix domain-containing protein [Bacteroidales bacterium]
MKKLIYNIHLVLGLVSGIIVFIVAITGCAYVFKSEIEEITQPWRRVDAQVNESFLPPSELKPVAQAVYPERLLHGISYGRYDDAAEVLFYEPKPLFYQGIILNPYTGDIIKVKNYKKDFFHFILQGHFQLWLPSNIGQPIIAIAILVFVLLLISGIVLWWPKRNATRQSFQVKWAAPWKRKLYDLHSVLGIYVWLVLLVIAITGLVWGFQWFSKGLYSLTGGEKDLAFSVPISDSTAISSFRTGNPVDYVWQKMHADYPEATAIEVHFPHDQYESIYAHVNPSDKTYWKTDFRYFDQYTLNEIEVDNVWGKLENASAADIIRRMNYDIHTGAIGGISGKILAFLASLIAASLPITGFLMWWKMRNEKSKLRKELEI